MEFCTSEEEASLEGDVQFVFSLPILSLRSWYESGRLLKKKNTFEDVIYCVKHLQDKLYCSPFKTCIAGHLEGGLAAAVAVNLRPELFCAAILSSPFLDILTSLKDRSQPLTVEEPGEWGNPIDAEEVYRYIWRFRVNLSAEWVL